MHEAFFKKPLRFMKQETDFATSRVNGKVTNQD